MISDRLRRSTSGLPVFLFLGSLLRPRWGHAALNLAANTLSAFFEGSTFGILAVALHVLSSPSPSVSALLGSALGGWLDQLLLLHGREPVFVGLVLLAILAQFLRSGFQFIAEFIAVHLQTRVHAETYKAIYAKFLRMPFPRVSSQKLGELTHPLTLTEDLYDVVGRLGEFIRTCLMIACYAALLLWISWPMTLLAAVCYGLVSGLFRRMLRRVVEHASTLLWTATDLHERATEFLQATRLLHSFGRQEESIRVVHSLAETGLRHRRKAILWSNVVEPITDTLTVLGAATFLLIGYAAVSRAGGGELPALLAFLLALYRVTPRLRSLNATLAVLASMLPGLRRIQQVLEEPEDRQEGANLREFHGLREGIELCHVTLQYLPKEPPAVANLSMRIPRGSFVALVGSSGAGKSSVADLLLRLFEPTSGQILADGEDVRNFRRSSWRSRLGVVAQDPFLFHATIRENIAFGRPEATLEEIIAASRAAHAEEFIRRLSQGYDTAVGDRGYRLSGGQCQRVALARALLRQPDLLILDEATSALDSESERLIQQALLEQRGIRTIFAIAHRLSTISQADEIFVLAEGRLVERGRHEELLARGGIYARLWAIQSHGQMAETAGVREEQSG